MGSGKLIKQAIKKYGVENFTKEILFVFDSEEEMNAKEKELVILGEQSYNLCPGGRGGFGYINTNKHLKTPIAKLNAARLKKMKNDPEFAALMRDASRKAGDVRREQIASMSMEERKVFASRSFLGRLHTEESKERMRIAQRKRRISK